MLSNPKMASFSLVLGITPLVRDCIAFYFKRVRTNLYRYKRFKKCLWFFIALIFELSQAFNKKQKENL
jgi:hypothetical protein